MPVVEQALVLSPPANTHADSWNKRRFRRSWEITRQQLQRSWNLLPLSGAVLTRLLARSLEGSLTPKHDNEKCMQDCRSLQPDQTSLWLQSGPACAKRKLPSTSISFCRPQLRQEGYFLHPLQFSLRARHLENDFSKSSTETGMDVAESWPGNLQVLSLSSLLRLLRALCAARLR